MRLVVPLALLLLVAGTGSLAGQLVHGRVTSEGAPLEGAIVVLLDADGAVAASALSAADGTFTLRGMPPGRYRPRIERIGHAAVEAGAVTVAGADTSHVELIAVPRAIALDPIVAEGEGRCELRPEAGARTAALWDEARKALTATALVAREQRLLLRAVRWERTLHAVTEAVLEETARELIMLRGSPFRAVPAVRLMNEGFAVRADGGHTLYGPDAEVLLSDAFLDTHCFRVRESRDRALIGLGFEPIEGRTQPDIRGVFWLGRADAALRFIEYTFVNIDVPGPPELYNGRTELGRLPDGSWAVMSWRIRSPRIVVTRRPGRDRVDVASLHEEGGRVVQVTVNGRPLQIPPDRH